jgi:hypothetical protein
MPLVFRKGKHGLEYRSEAPHLVAKRVAEGWSTSKADALAPKPAAQPADAKPPVPVAAAPAPAIAAPVADDLPVTVDDEPEADDAPPTRAELEAKAAELGIKVDKRWSDKTLGERIESLLADVNATSSEG